MTDKDNGIDANGHEEGDLFIPIIRSSEADSHKVARAQLRALYQVLLQDLDCAKAIAPYKSNGTPLGHKVLDDGAAVTALSKAAPDALREQLDAIKQITHWDKCQVLNGVLRRHWEMDKRGKLTGKLAPRLQHTTTEEKPEQAEQPQQGQPEQPAQPQA